MWIERVEMVGFRGINRLSLQLEQDNVLIGENAWGKSSLLDALTLLLAPQSSLYHFTRHDFWQPAGESGGQAQHLQIILTFREKEKRERLYPRYARLRPLWAEGAGKPPRIIYRLEGEMNGDNAVLTSRSFLDASGQPLVLDDVDGLALELVRLHPVLRLRDARFARRPHDEVADFPETEEMARQLDSLVQDLVPHLQGLNDSQIRHGLSAIVQLLEHYFAEQGSTQTHYRLMRRHAHDEQSSWRYLDRINRLLDQPGRRCWRLIVLNLLYTLLQARGVVRLHPDARPLLLVEDPETRLHPIMLSVAWHLFTLLPLQKVTTTNSSELLSLAPVEQICRLVRAPGQVVAWRVGNQGMSVEDYRRIEFHICFKRPSAFFARCWLLVEGETEVWIINKLADQCGYQFGAEGVKVIEFAQSGLRPLIHFAQHMGINWHVLSDGDEAGKRYAATVSSLLGKEQQRKARHLTVLPAPDIEHFMYLNGFAEVYHKVANVPYHAQHDTHTNVHKVIEKAIHRSSKPDLAIEVADHAAKRGNESIPPLFPEMFSRVLKLARGRWD